MVEPTGFSPEQAEEQPQALEESIIDALEPGPKRGPLHFVAMATSSWMRPDLQQAPGNPLPVRNQTPRARGDPVVFGPGASEAQTPTYQAGPQPAPVTPSSAVLVQAEEISIAASSTSSDARMLILQAQLDVEVQRERAAEQNIRTAELRAELVAAQAKAGSSRGSMRSRSSRKASPLPLIDDLDLHDLERPVGEVIDAGRAEEADTLTTARLAEHEKSVRTASGNARRAEKAKCGSGQSCKACPGGHGCKRICQAGSGGCGDSHGGGRAEAWRSQQQK